jgi:aminobenzoyl-glutamate transport protein
VAAPPVPPPAPPTRPASTEAPRWTRLLDGLERAGNRLPDPVSLFAGLAVLVVLISGLAEARGWSAVHPGTGALVTPVSLLSGAGLRRMLADAVGAFAAFPPLGTVLVVMLGVGVAERSGLVAAALRQAMGAVPPSLVTLTLAFVSVNSSLAADAGIVVLPLLAAALFHGLGRHPLAGLAAAFAGVSAGFSANLLLTALDPLLAGLTEPAARLVAPDYRVEPTANYYFMIASTFLLVGAVTWVTTRIVEPRLGPWRPAPTDGGGPAGPEAEPEPPAPARVRRGLLGALLAFLGFSALVAVLVLVGPLRGAEEAPLRPLFAGLVPLMAVGFFLPGLVYGVLAGTIRSDKDVARMAGDTMATMGSYVVLAFVAAQFIAYFSWTNLGTILAVKGAGALKAAGLGGAPLLLAFMGFAMALNLLVASSSAKWAVMAPVFVPMLMLLGFSPEAVQAAYRVADSCTNIVTPCMPYFPLLIAFARKYEPGTGLGTLIALVAPYSLVFALLWIPLLLAWLALDLPLGPGVLSTWSAGG